MATDLELVKRIEQNDPPFNVYKLIRAILGESDKRYEARIRELEAKFVEVGRAHAKQQEEIRKLRDDVARKDAALAAAEHLINDEYCTLAYYAKVKKQTDIVLALIAKAKEEK
jgi:hypothetical protein